MSFTWIVGIFVFGILLAVLAIVSAHIKTKTFAKPYANFLHKTDTWLNNLKRHIACLILGLRKFNIKEIVYHLIALILKDISKLASYFESSTKKASLKLIKKPSKKGDTPQFLQDISKHKKEVLSTRESFSSKHG